MFSLQTSEANVTITRREATFSLETSYSGVGTTKVFLMFRNHFPFMMTKDKILYPIGCAKKYEPRKEAKLLLEDIMISSKEYRTAVQTLL